MAMYREILTKAVIAKGKKTFVVRHNFALEHEVSKLLGCWIINHNFTPVLKNGQGFIEGSYSVNIWYAYNNDSKTAILEKEVKYKEEIPLKIKSGEVLNENMQTKGGCGKYPACTNLRLLEDGHIEVSVEKGLFLDIIGETVLKVQLSDIIEDEFSLDEEIESNVNPNYLNKR